MRKKLSSTVYLEEEQLIALKAYTLKTGVPASVFIRRAIDAALSQVIESGMLNEADMGRASVTPLGLRNEGRAGNLEDKIEAVLRRMLGNGEQSETPLTIVKK